MTLTLCLAHIKHCLAVESQLVLPIAVNVNMTKLENSSHGEKMGMEIKFVKTVLMGVDGRTGIYFGLQIPEIITQFTLDCEPTLETLLPTMMPRTFSSTQKQCKF